MAVAGEASLTCVYVYVRQAPMITPRRSTASIPVERWRGGIAHSRSDSVTVEEPMEIRLALGQNRESTEASVAVTMRTPGDDFELAAGFLFTEGIVADRSVIGEIRYCTGEEPQEYNIVSVSLEDPSSFEPALLNRNFYMTSSCGVCGKASLEAVELSVTEPVPGGDIHVSPAVIRSVPESLRAAQPVFERTGSIHSAALIRPDGEITLLREDVGRHNAVDKVIGHELLEDRLPIHNRFLAVSGRSSFEIMQKALVAGISMVVAVGAPSSLALDVARQFKMTLVGFTKPDGFNVYCDPGRVAPG